MLRLPASWPCDSAHGACDFAHAQAASCGLKTGKVDMGWQKHFPAPLGVRYFCVPLDGRKVCVIMNYGMQR